MMKYFLTFFFVSHFCLGYSQQTILPGAERTELYISALTGKKVAIVANQTSLVSRAHLLDTLLSMGIQVVKVFSPEHGFRGNEDAGEQVASYKDRKSGVPVVSLYGKKVKPSPGDLKNVDLVIFDLQDVGVRFFTYLSTLHYILEACAENRISLLILDRPNPNSFYVDGPVLEPAFSSFVGLHPVPVVYGMTIGEYALMVNGEGWLKNGEMASLRVIPCENYTHASLYRLPVKPSPNLPDMRSVYLYPSLALFEGTSVSVGRGTLQPFALYGSPLIDSTGFTFVPESLPGMASNPLYKGIVCHGWDLSKVTERELTLEGYIRLEYLEKAYAHSRNKETFFNSYFNLLAGNRRLQEQIKNKDSEEQIRASWGPELEKFRSIRSKYLLYP